LSVVPGGVQIHLVPARTSAMDVAFRGSYVSIGAAAFNAQVAAARHGLQASITAFPTERDPDLAVSVALTPGSDSELAKLYPEMVQRITNRNALNRHGPCRVVALTNRQRCGTCAASTFDWCRSLA
jgi:hypothetical protein